MFLVHVNRCLLKTFLCTFVGLSNIALEAPLASGFSSVLQVQDFSNTRANISESHETETVEKLGVWGLSVDEGRAIVISSPNKYPVETGLHLNMHEPAHTDLLSGVGSNVGSSFWHGSSFPESTAATSSMKQPYRANANMHRKPENNWPVILPGLSLHPSESNMPHPAQGGYGLYEAHSYGGYGALDGRSIAYGQRAEHPSASWSMPPPISHLTAFGCSRDSDPTTLSLERQHLSAKATVGSCKLFGIPLFSHPVSSEPSMSGKSNADTAGEGLNHLPPESYLADSTLKAVHPEDSSAGDLQVVAEKDKTFQNSNSVSREVKGKMQSGSTRSCTKVNYIYHSSGHFCNSSPNISWRALLIVN